MSSQNTKTRAKKRAGALRLIRSVRQNEDGVTAIEFGIIAMPFLFLIVAMLETALVFMTTLDLENAVKDASRQIRTGQAQVAGLSSSQFRDLVCDQTSLIANCKTTDKLIVDVRSYDDFQAISFNPSDYYDDEGNFTGGEQFSMGSGLKVVVVQVYYKMSLFAQIPFVGLADSGPSSRMLNAIAVFRNEPFS